MNETLRIQQMRQFVIAAEHGSFRAAALATYRSAAAVSTAMAELEQQIGSPLFEEGQRGRLTPLGQTLAPLFAELVRTHDRVVRDVRQITRAERGLVTVAVVPFLAEEWFSTVLSRFMKEHGDVTVRVIDQRSKQARQMVVDGLADIAIVAHLGEDPKLNFHPVAIDTFGIICRKDDPIARPGRPANWKALQGRNLIGNDAFETVASQGLGQWVENNVVASISSRFSMMDCIRNGIGITVLPRLTKPPTAADLAFVPLTNPVLSRSMGIATRRDQTLPPAARGMFALIEAELREFAKAHGVQLANDAPAQAAPAAGKRVAAMKRKA
ncbi:MAG TPA: LysR family transcriptional regulator [Pseudolabrys sp.]|nr:LysR family transcriptional regulator [Pseudolabrys sp.]